MKLPREAGFEVLSIKTIDPERVLKCSRSGRANWYGYELIKACVETELQLFDREKPDMVLTDFRLFQYQDLGHSKPVYFTTSS